MNNRKQKKFFKLFVLLLFSILLQSVFVFSDEKETITLELAIVKEKILEIEKEFGSASRLNDN